MTLDSDFIPRSIDMLYVDDLAQLAQKIIEYAVFAHSANSNAEVATHIDIIEKLIKAMGITVERLKPPPFEDKQ